MRSIALITCFLATAIGNIAYAADAPTWFANQRNACIQAVGGEGEINWGTSQAACCLYKDGGELFSSKLLKSSAAADQDCINLLLTAYKQNSEVSHAGVELATTFETRDWWYKNITDLPAAYRIPSWWSGERSNCAIPIKQNEKDKANKGGCCLYNAKGAKLAEVTVESEWGIDNLRTLCKQKMQDQKGNYFGLLVCKLNQHPGGCYGEASSWDWWYGDIYE